MVQKNFGIYGEASIAARLYVEIGEKYIACMSIAENNKAMHSFELFEFNENDAFDFEELLRIIKLHSKLFDQSFVAVNIIWGNKLSSAVPTTIYSDETAADYLLLETGFSTSATLLKDNAGKQTVTYYVSPEDIAAIKHYFPAAKYSHKKALLYSKQSSIKQDGDVVKISFYIGQFSLVIYKNGELHLCQQCEYQTTEDVLYYLLNDMQQTGVDKEQAVVYVGGMIDKASSLFKELNLYVPGLKADNLASEQLSKDVFAEYPAHYFSPFYNLVV